MKIKRNEYKPKPITENSLQNEPRNRAFVEERYKRSIQIEYPDMYAVYKNVEKLLGVSNFILTTSCERALETALLLAKPDVLYVEDPSWQMPYVKAAAFDINARPLSLLPKNDEELFPARYDYSKLDPNDGCPAFYVTDTYNNILLHETISYDKLIANYNHAYIINDATYILSKETLCNSKQYCDLDTDTSYDVFTIASFGKRFGCGIRFGILTYPEHYHDRAQLLCEQYISGEAAQTLCDLKEWPEFDLDHLTWSGYWSDSAWHATYITSLEKPPYDESEYKVIEWCGHTLYRTGRRYLDLD